MTDEFTDIPASREGGTPLLIGIFSPSGAGKTYSALRLATGIQSVVGGDIFGVDTEAGRMKHYADKFAFRWVEFKAPFGADRYEKAMLYCVGRGAKTIIIDSTSHMHEGEGGLLEQHAAETKRLAKAWNTTEAKAQMSAWIEPKAKLRHFINTMLQQRVNLIFCFRAREKLQIRPGKDPVALGYMPIASDELSFEMTVTCFLPPGARGVPVWNPELPGERAMTKLPQQFEDMFGLEGPLNEDIGRKLAEWAGGAKPFNVDDMVGAYTNADLPKFTELESERRKVWSSIRSTEQKRLKDASVTAEERIRAAERRAKEAAE